MKKEIIIAKDKVHLKYLIQTHMSTESFNCNLNHIDTSLITDMSELFFESGFNGDISNWNVQNVEDMSGMFAHSKFNGDISRWSVSSVIDMNDMFYDSLFNGDISDWNVSSVENMSGMFFLSCFNYDLSKWNVSNVTYMYDTFHQSNIKKLPYWANIQEFEKRRKIVLEYQEIYQNKTVLEKLIIGNETINIYKI